ncbi:MAG TPA: DMT family transporter [Pyrinomonadaceae bacterium]|nr:DMT family transporter [Pyrinomonadaceae bacterium]
MKIFVWLLLALIWSSTWIFIKFGLKDLPPFGFVSLRFLLAAAILAPFVLFRKDGGIPKDRTQWRLLVLTGILQFTINYSSVFWAEQYITSGLAAVLQAMIVVFGLILAWIFLPAEKITAQKIAAVGLGVVGVAVIFIDQLTVHNELAFAACVVIVVGAYAAAQSSILVKAKAASIRPEVIVFWQMIFGLPPIIIYSLLTEGSPLDYHWSAVAVGSIFYLGFVGTVVAFCCYYWLLNRIESTNAMMISLVTPLLAVLIGWLALGETLPAQTGIGGVLIIASVALLVFKKRRIAAQVAD